MPICTNVVSQDLSASCTNPMYEGMAPKAYLYNREEIASVTQNDNVVSAISMLSGKKGYAVQMVSKTPYNNTANTLNSGDNRNTVDKAFAVILQDDGPLVGKNVKQPLLNGEFVVVYETKWNNTTGDAKFRIAGLETGLKMTGYDQNFNDTATGSGTAIVLTETAAPTPDIYFYDTDVPTTRAALEATLTPAP